MSDELSKWDMTAPSTPQLPPDRQAQRDARRLELAALPTAKLEDGALPDGRKPWPRRQAVRAGLLSAGEYAILRELDRLMDRDGEPLVELHPNQGGRAGERGVWRDSLERLEHAGYISLEDLVDDVARVGITPAGDRVLRLA